MVENAMKFLHTNDITYRSNPCHKLLKCFSIVKRENDGTAMLANLAWSIDKNTVYYLGGVSISMLEMQKSVKLGVSNANVLLVKLLASLSMIF